MGINVHSALPVESVPRIPEPSTAEIFSRMGSVMPNKSLTTLPFSSNTSRSTVMFSKLMTSLLFSMTSSPRKAERVNTASWSISMRTLAQTPLLQ